VLDIRVVGLHGIAIVPVGERERRGFNIDPWRWCNNDGRVRIGPPVGPERHHEPRTDEHTHPSRPMEPSVPMSSMPMSAVPMPSVPVASIPMPATVGMPWHHADQEQQGDHDEYASPRLPSSHGLTSVLTLLFACDTPPDVYCTHDRPRVASTEAQETRDGRPKLGGAIAMSADRRSGCGRIIMTKSRDVVARGDPRTSSMRAR
jgi:hypothetical protein